MTALPAFALQDLVLELGGTVVLRIAALELAQGAVTAVVGPNGAGKTSLLEVLAGLRTPRVARFAVFGEVVTPGTAAWEELRKKVTYVAQRPLLFRRSVFANVAYGLKVRGAGDRVRVQRALARVGLQELAWRPAWRLSAGEAQRVAVARALAIDPPVYLFDEPTANLDRDFVPEFESLVRELAARGRTVVFSTHALDQAYRLVDRRIALEGGRLVPFPLVNLVTGAVQLHAGETILDAGPLRLVLAGRVSPQVFRATVAIDPESILLSREPLRSSARNCLAGVVSRIEGSDAGVLVHVQCGQELVARITAHAFAELGLAIGDAVFATFKSTAVHWIDPRPAVETG